MSGTPLRPTPVPVGAMADEGGPHFAIEYDVLMAHRQVPVLREDWGRQAGQVKGSAASAAKEALVRIAEAANKRYVTTGLKAGRMPRLKARLEDLPQDVLDEVLWLNTVVTFGGGSAG